MQQFADQPAGEHPVHRFHHGGQRPGQPQPAGDGLGQLVGGGGDQPHLLAGVQVHLGQLSGARPDLVGDDLVVDLLAQGGQLRGGAALDERQPLAPAGGDVVAVFPSDQLKLGLRVHEPRHVAVGEVVARRQAPAEVQQRGPLHQGVVHVEERGGGQIDRRRAVRRGHRRVGGHAFHRAFGAGVGGHRAGIGHGRIRAARVGERHHGLLQMCAAVLAQPYLALAWPPVPHWSP
ncbi:hypothetical protein C1Y40_03399 [Mycobacterium talmoniae]|uniref:Uncharacterized protein n=1 Tax=Mycobacterium talmoniae TaxID=1858794 RepID=A0A2S8BIH2_9MYCO|nr:hypothetical protein C1Y40_03399 [Mycobacterium talmoniae]